MGTHTETQAVETTLEGYHAAKSFWKTWHEDEDAEMHFGTRDGREVAEPVLVGRYGMHPLEARYISNLALSSVLDNMEVRGE